MTVGLISNYYAEMFGLPRYNLSLIDHLTAIDFRYQLITPKPPRIIDWANKVTSRFGYDLTSTYINYPVFIKTQDNQVIHLTNHTLSTLLFLNRFNKVIITVHDIESEWDHFSKTYTGIRYAIYRFLHRLSLSGIKKADYVITDTDHVRNQIHQNLGIDLKKISVIPLGVDHQIFCPFGEKYLKFSELNSKGPIILHVGTFAPRKNLANLILAFAELVKEYPSARLVKLGKVNWPLDYERAINIARDFNLIDRITFIPGLTDTELASLYRSADMLVFPSLYEGFGLPVLEAMACGLPVITSNASCLPEVAGNSALLIDPTSVNDIAKAMRRVLSETGFAAELRAKGLEHAKKFTWERTAKETVAIYQRVLSQD